MKGFLRSMAAVGGTILLLTSCAAHGLRCTKLQSVNGPVSRPSHEAHTPSGTRHP